MFFPSLNAKISRKFHRQGSGSEKTLGQDPDPDPKDLRAGSGSEMTLHVGSGFGINSFGSATLEN